MFKYILFITALVIAASAGFFSITGIGQLFTGAMVSAMIMAAGLELGKLVSISFLFRFWTRIGTGMKIYFIAASIVLMGITSTGVYGYLSSAYASSATSIKSSENQLALIETQKTSLTSSIQRLTDRTNALQAVRTQQENRLDKMVGQKGMADQQKAVAAGDKAVQDLQTQMTKLELQRDSLNAEQTKIKNGISTTGKIGTFYYIAQSFGIPLDTIVHWFILAIVFVFDPLSVSLLVAYQIVDRQEQEAETPLEANFSQGVRGKYVEQYNESLHKPEWVPVPSGSVDQDAQRAREGIRGERIS